MSGSFFNSFFHFSSIRYFYLFLSLESQFIRSDSHTLSVSLHFKCFRISVNPRQRSMTLCPTCQQHFHRLTGDQVPCNKCRARKPGLSQIDLQLLNVSLCFGASDCSLRGVCRIVHNAQLVDLCRTISQLQFVEAALSFTVSPCLRTIMSYITLKYY